MVEVFVVNASNLVMELVSGNKLCYGTSNLLMKLVSINRLVISVHLKTDLLDY